MPYDGLKEKTSTNFDEIEIEKENILPLKEGRSAQGLSQTLREDASQLNTTRLAFERRLLEELEDMDDPFELFMEYITWINHAYPQGGSSKQSGMLDVLERCLMYLRDMETYRNDPRFLKLWLWYIELFAADSTQESKDIYIYMLRKQIGSKLSLFYESFGALLFEMGRYREAHYILRMGIEENARPQHRLLKRLDEFETRLRSMNVDLESGPQVGPQFLEPSSSVILGRERSSVIFNGRSGISTDGQVDDESHAKPAKYDIFRDTENPESVNNDINVNGWDILDGRANRTKENQVNLARIVSGSNVGGIQQVAAQPTKEGALDKLTIFKDALGRSDPVYKIVRTPGKRPEKIDCNFNLIYPDDRDEYCFEEILARSRNLYLKREKTAIVRDSEVSPARKKRKNMKALMEKRTELPSSQPPGSIDDIHSNEEEFHKQITGNQYEPKLLTSTLPLKSEKPKGDLDSDKQPLQAPNSPTITFFSKNAMDEVYSMFNQHYKEPKPIAEGDETTGKFGLLDNFTQEFTRQDMDDLTEVKRADLGGNTKTHDIELESKITSPRRETSETDPSSLTNRSKVHEFMTPIQERNEKVFETPIGHRQVDEDAKGQYDSAASSPFLTQPQLELKVEPHLVPPIIDDPLNKNLRGQLLGRIQPPLDDYDSFYRYHQPLKMSALLKRIHKVSKSENKNPIVDFKKTGDLYCIRTELGEGGYATVYLAESSTGNLKALKVEKPSSVWEYYILKQVEKKLRGSVVLRSIINASSLHCFQDESYLVLNYASQGTVLDLVNLQKEKSRGPVDELLCMFMTVELIKVMEAIHRVGIVHGDVKPDNCMIRFENGNLGPYRSDGSGGWCNKGIYLIDFGRSFDMSLFQPGTKFRANWKTDQQDCIEMRQGKPWSYEADYFGLAGIIHSLLFGELIETTQISGGGCKLKRPLKRYWKQDIWSAVFYSLLNSDKFDDFPITSRLSECRVQIETYLSDHANDKLSGIIRDLESELAYLKR